MERIHIKDISGAILLITLINEGCKRKFTLMKEDYITLKFSLESPVYFKLGSYVECDFGLFEVCDLQKPVFNADNAGYNYELQLDAYYWKWKNKIFKYTPEVAGQEASWNLTASLDVQASIVLRNLKALGYTYKGQDFELSIDSTVENKAQLMSYDNINILDACFEMAKKWDCECWVTENIIHFGRCEFGDAVNLEIGVNVKEMSRSDSQSTYATRIYAFGSTRNIPANYRPVDETMVVNGVVQKRLMLPEGVPYIDAYPDMATEEAIEQVVIFDEVYPRRTGTMSDITTKKYTETIENTDGTATEKKWNAYRFKDTGITFSKDYILPGEELKITFRSGKLNGLVFAVTFDPDGKDEQLWEIVRNEDYGRPLPDEVLIPENGDTYILSGWDSTKITEMGLVAEAQLELKDKAEKYVAKSKIDPNTYNCTMMPDDAYREDGVHNLYGVGQKVNLINKAYFDNGRQSRIIGFEFNLDLPYDSPVYTVGETAAYSRIGELEDKIENITLKGQTYVGGGGSGVYVIKRNDSTPASDSNVFSALLSLAMFMRKDQPDSTDYLASFNAGITIGTDKKELYDIIRSVDSGAVPSDTSVYSSLAMDERYINKYQPDSTLYPVDFMSGLSINSKRIGDIIRYYDENKPVATDANIYSALQTDQRIEEEFGKIDDRYIRKDKEDVAHKHITFEEGITVHQLAKLMNLDVKQLATIAQAVCAVVRSSKFVDGFAGEGYQIWQDIATGDWNMTLDRLTVRKVLTIYEMVVAKIRSVGGMIVVSAANGIIKSAERIGDQYVIEFDDANQFVPDDLMRCQVFSPAGLKYYWVRISAVNGEKVYVPASEFAGVEPVKGDEVVLMGNTTDKKRQNLILISATEDGQPRFDCLDGVKSKNLEGCLKVRIGSLDGISDSRFPSDMQPGGYGIYGNNCFLTGIFVLSNGKDVMTMFSIMEGMIKSEISSVRNEINAKDNYLDNAAFADNMNGWSGNNRIRIFSVSNRLLYFNNNFYANKENFANIASDGTKNVLRLKNSSITQKNADFARHPEFDLYDIMGTDADGNEVVTGQQYRARMFYVSFKYKVNRPGTLRVYFKNENPEGFEEYVPIDYIEVLNPSEEFKVMEIAGKWNGTGDFYISFSGDMYLYSLALSDNRLADMEEKFTMRFEATDKKIQANLDEIKKTGTKLEEYHSEFLLTARNLQTKFTEDLSDAESRITEAYKSYVNLTARDLTVQFTADINKSESRITEAYTAAIRLSAQGLQTEFTADITDMEAGITAAYKSYVNLTAQNLQAGFTEDLTDLRTGITEEYTSAIDLSARGLRADFNSSISDINGKLTSHSSSFHVTASKIDAMVSATDSISNTIRTAGWITTAEGNKLWATITTVNGINNRLTTHEASFHVTATKIEGIVSDITEQGTNYSKLTQTVNGITAEVNDISGRYSSLKVQIDAIGALVGDGTEGSFSEFQQTIDRLTTQVADNKTAAAGALTAAQNAASAASAAQGKANSAYDKAVSNATAITQTNSSISAIAGRFNADGTLKEGAAWVTTTDANTLWVRKDGIISAINQTAESVTIDAARINLNGAITANGTFKIGLDGSMEATGGMIAGLKISGDTLTNEGFNNDACIILRNDVHSTFAAIGGNTLPASSGIRAVARFENEESNGYWGNTNVAMIVRASGATHNRAVVATGDILTNGLNVGYAFHEFSFVSANKWLELAPVKSGIMFVYFNYSNCAVVLPTLQHVCESLGISYGTPFAIRLTVISTAGENGKFYGRNKVISGTSGNQFPELRKWDGGVDETGYDFNPHDSFEVCLFYQGGTSYIPSIGNAYRAYITRISR